MATKSIVEIDVNDARFQAFKALHDAYIAALKSAPAQWALVNRQVGAGAQATGKQLTVTRQLVQSIGQMPAALARSTAGWGALDRVTLRVATSVGHITTSILRWGGIGGLVGGLLGLGGLFGIDALAEGAAGRRRRALGLGTGFGGLQSFGGAFGRFVDSDFLDRVAGGRFDLSQRVGLLGAGLSAGQIDSGDTATTGTALLRALKRIADTTDPRLFGQVIQARRLPTTPEELERLRNTRGPEFERQIGQQAEYQRRLQIGDDTLRRWQDFVTALDFAGKMIDKTFVTGLVPLAGPLGKLSTALTDVVASFLDAAAKKHWIEDLGDALEKFARYVATPDFDAGVKKFVDDLGLLASAVGRAVGWFTNLFGGGSTHASVRDRANRAVLHRQGNRTAGELRLEREQGGATAFGQLWRIWSGNGAAPGAGQITPDQLLGLVRQSEGSGDAAVSPKGAIGRYQIEPATAGDYGVSRGQLFDPVVNEMVARRHLQRLIQKYHGDVDSILAAYNAGEGRFDSFRAGKNSLPLETQKYVTGAHHMTGYAPTVVTIDNNTGGNVNVTANGLKN
jgi:hypothetical protein